MDEGRLTNWVRRITFVAILAAVVSTVAVTTASAQADLRLVSALKNHDKEYLTSIPLKDLQSGTSELKSWISLAGVLENEKAPMNEIDYVPCYRSQAGTGTANGFYWWDLKA